MKRILLVLTDELFDAVESARGKTARNPWIEAQLRRVKAVRNAANESGITFPERDLRPYEYGD